MKKWLATHGFSIVLLTIIVILISIIGYTGWINQNCLYIIDLKDEVIENQQRVIEDLAGIDIPPGMVVEPRKVY